MSRKKPSFSVSAGGVHFANTVSGTSRKRPAVWLRGLLALLGIVGTLMLFTKAFPFDFSPLVCAFWCALPAGLLLLSGIKPAAGKWLISLLLLLFLTAGFLLRHELLAGLLGFYNHIVVLAEEAFQMPPTIELELKNTLCTLQECMRLTFYYASAFLTFGCFLFIVVFPSAFMTLVFTLPLAVLSLYLRSAALSSFWGTLFLFAAWFSCLTMELSDWKLSVKGESSFLLCRDLQDSRRYYPTNHYRTPSVSQAGAAAAAVIFLAGALALSITEAREASRIGWKQLQELGYQAGEKLEQVIYTPSGESQKHTPPEISLGAVDHADYQNLVDLKVVSSRLPDTPLYLHGYSGCEYTGSSWKNFSSRETAPYEQMLTGFETGGNCPAFSGFLYGSRFFPEQKAELTITNYLADPQRAYLPYFSRIQPEDFSLVRDLYARSGGKMEYQVSAFLLSENQYEGYESGTPSEQEKEYLDYVSKMYLRLPEYGLERLRSDWEKIRQGNFTDWEKVRLVQSYLKDRAVYTRTPGKAPKDADFVEYFLYESREGYCTYFASAGTVILRELGVPARYAQGYVVFPDEWEKTGEGFVSLVKDRFAHAWTEIYVKGVGWVPVEMTPPSFLEEEVFEAESVSKEVLPETSASSQTEKTTSASAQEPESLPESSGEFSSGTEFENPPPADPVFPAVLILLGIGAAWLAVRFAVLGVRKRAFSSSDFKQRLLAEYRWFCKACKKLKLPAFKGEAVPKSFQTELASRLLPAFREESLLLKDNSIQIERFVFLAWKADFSSSGVTKEESAEADRFVRFFKASLKKELKPFWTFVLYLSMIL